MSDTDTDTMGIDAVPEEFQEVVQWAKRYKDGVVDEAEPDDNGDVRPRVAFYRGDELVAEGMALHVDRDEGLDLANHGVQVYDATKIEFVLDAHMTDNAFYERFGRLPDPHELQDLCDNEGACDIGLTTDCILVGVAERGRLVMINLPYHVDRRMEPIPAKVAKAIKGEERTHIKREGTTYTRVTRTCHWQDAKVWVMDDNDANRRMTGNVPDVLRTIMETKTLGVTLAETDVVAANFDLTPEEARLHQDIAGTRILAQLGFLMALVEHSEEEAEIIRESVRRTKWIAMVDPTSGEVVTGDDEGDELQQVLDEVIGVQRLKLDRARQERHRDELARRERNRAARVDGAPSAEDVTAYAETIPQQKSSTASPGATGDTPRVTDGDAHTDGPGAQ